MSEYNPADGEVGEKKSKSQRKREMTALQDMGTKLTELNEQQLARFPLSEDLRLALREYRHIRKREAKRRQLQYIGKLMRNADCAGIAAKFNELPHRPAPPDRQTNEQNPYPDYPADP
jgi:ribosome-associated protein